MKRGEHDKSNTALVETFKFIKLGKGKGELKKLLNISSSALSNRLKRLEDLGCINLVGKYGIELTGSSLNHPKVTRSLIDKRLNKRGHAHGSTFVFSQKNDLWNNKKIIKEFQKGRIEKLEYGSYRLDYKKFTILINREDFTIYSKKKNSYFSKNALHSSFFALKDLDRLARYLKGRYDLKGVYGIRIFREHYGLIFNKFAKWILDQGRKLEIKDDKKSGKTTIWVDDSKDDDVGLKELETGTPQKANTLDEWGEKMDRAGWPSADEMRNEIGEVREETQKGILEISKDQKELSQKIMNSSLVDRQLFSKVEAIEQVLNKVLDNEAKMVVEINNLKERR